MYAKRKKLATKIFVSEQRESLRRTAPIVVADRIHTVTLTPFYPLAGDDAFGCFVAEPLPYLAPHGVDVTTIAAQPFYRSHARPNASAPAATWCSFVSLPGPRGLATAGRFLYWRLLPVLRALNRRKKVDLIHAHSALPCGHAAMLLARALNVPFVVSVHGLDTFSTRQVTGISGERCRRQSDDIYTSARCVICVSNRVREQVAAGVSGPLDTAVVYNGTDIETFASGQGEEASKRCTVLSVGDVIPTKGQELVLRALAALKGKFPQIHYEIIGDGPALLSLQRLVTELKMESRVHFLGRRNRNEVAQALRRCTVFALPSSYEGLGCAYLEAMATGKPAIGCRGQGIEEVIRHGENGWLVGAGRLDEMTQALDCLLQDRELRDKIGKAARRTVAEQFTLAHQAERLSHIYRDCLR